MRAALALSAITVAVLAPFLGRAFHIDEPLFVWLADHLRRDPFDFYGFEVNWYGWSQPMSEVTKNPPLAGYYLALARSVLGPSEVAAHAAFLLPALACAFGVLALARRLCARPLEAALVAVLSPVFLVHATTVMCDVSMLALWCWALVLWLRGLDRDRRATLAAAAGLVALAGLTKYFGVALVPLLATYTLARGRRAWPALAWLAIPVAVFAAYQILTAQLYGRGLLLDAADYATEMHAEYESPFHRQLFVAFTFAGGCCFAALTASPLLWRRRTLAAWALVGAGGFAWSWTASALPGYAMPEFAPGVVAQCLLAAGGGVAVLALAATDLARRRDADSLLLALWVAGTFVFAGFVNWTNNGRSILPMAPAVAILIARRLAERAPTAGLAHRLACYAPAVGIALVVTWADVAWANSVRSAARELCEQFGRSERPLWFLGHWGFQHYMQEYGAHPVDSRRGGLRSGDLLVRPTKNYALGEANLNLLEPVAHRVDAIPDWVHTMSFSARAGSTTGAAFYASVFGPLPWAFGRPAPDEYFVFRLKPP